MLLFSGLLGVCSWIVEVVVIRQIPFVWNIAKRSTKASISISLIVAFAISTIFGAGGVHLLLASMIAVVLSHLTYRTAGIGGTIYERFNKTIRRLGERCGKNRKRGKTRKDMVSDRENRYRRNNNRHSSSNARSNKDRRS